jgi:hypothetical protein
MEIQVFLNVDHPKKVCCAYLCWRFEFASPFWAIGLCGFECVG